MQIGNYNFGFFKKQVSVSPQQLMREVSSSASPYFSDYQPGIYNPDKLFEKRGNYDLFDKMREDDQISSLLTLKKIVILNTGWVIECENENIKEFLTKCLTEYLDDVFEKKIFNMLSALDYGFSLSEKVVETIEDEGKSRWVFSSIKTRAPHSFELHSDKFGVVEKVVQKTEEGDVEIAPQKFIIYSYNAEFDNPYGKSDLNKGVYRSYTSKDAIIKFWNIYLERFGMPLTIGKVPKTARDSDKTTFSKILEKIQAKTSMVIPDDFNVDFLTAANGAGEYEKAIDKHNLMIARKLLIPDLIGLSGSQTGGGSYALGKKQFEIFYQTIEFIRSDIEMLINREMIDPLVFWNFGENEKATFKFNFIDEDKKEKDVRLWLDSIKTGKVPVEIPHVDWLLERIDAPCLSEEKKKEIAEAKERNPFKEKDEEEEDEGEEGEEEENNEENEDGEDEKTDGDKKKHTKIVYKRELSIYEKKVDFGKIVSDTEEIENRYKDELSSLYKLSINSILDEIKQKKIVERKRYDLINSLKLKYTGRIHFLTKKMLNDGYEKGQTTVKKHKLVSGVTDLNDIDIANWIREYAYYITSAESDFIIGKIKPVLIEGITAGRSIKDMVMSLETALSGYDISTKPYRLEAIVRTVTLSGYNEARLKEYDTLSDDIVAFQYSAILDDRTSALCESLDKNGQGIYNPDYAQSINPPNHFNCRSVLVPIFSDEPTPDIKSLPANIEKDVGGFWKTRRGM